MKILHVIANPKPVNESNSKQISEAFLETLKKGNSKVEVMNLDLYQNPPPFYSYETYRYFWYPVFQAGYQPNENEKKSAAYALRQGKQFLDSDVLMITTPMWNFSIPSILKAWMDQVLAPGLTYEMSSQGPKPLHHIQKVLVFVSSGGAYRPEDRKDNLTHQIRSAFGFVGIQNIEFVWADGQNTFFFKDHAERKEKAKAQARTLATKI